MESLTKRQREVLDFVDEYLKRKKYSPSLKEISQHFGLSSVATVHRHLQLLQQKGFLAHQPNSKRSLTLVPTRELDTEEEVELPLLGLIAAGEPIEALPYPDAIAVPAKLVPRGKRTFVLKVKGASMIDEGIRDGDYVIVQEAQTAENGQTVVALVDGDKATLKKFYHESGQVRLQPANEKMEPIIVKEGDLQIQGIAVGLMRKF